VLIFEIIRWALRGFPKDPVDPELERIALLPLNVAIDLTMVVLADATKFACIDAKGPGVFSAMFSPINQAFFDRYARVEIVGSNTWVSRDLITPSRSHLGYHVIGQSDMGGDIVDVVIRASEDRVYDLDGHERDDSQRMLSSWSSIYHWILFHNYAFFGDIVNQ
jgi:hypothetical protein